MSEQRSVWKSWAVEEPPLNQFVLCRAGAGERPEVERFRTEHQRGFGRKRGPYEEWTEVPA